MDVPVTTDRTTAPVPTAARRALAVVLLAAAIAVAVSSADLHAWLTGFLPAAEGLIRTRPLVGGSVFVAFAALSAMLAFVSSAVLVPIAVYVWGKAIAFLLLWMGWTLGGIAAYTISRSFGRAVVRRLVSVPAFVHYETRLRRQASFGLVLLLQLGLPSEVPGYLLGLLRYSFWKYLAALAIAELPYALATVYLGAGFIERRTSLLIGVGAALAAFSGWAIHTLHARLSLPPR